MGTYYGVGINDYEGKVFTNGSHLKSYQNWHNMLERCYSKKYKSKYKTYENCVVCDDWLVFTKFKEWFDLNYVEGYCLDKDILQSGIDLKIYSQETCIFIHPTLNRMFSKKPSPKNGNPCGVEVSGGKYRARLKANGKYLSLGTFETVEDARSVYLKHKYAHMVSEICRYENRPMVVQALVAKIENFI